MIEVADHTHTTGIVIPCPQCRDDRLCQKATKGRLVYVCPSAHRFQYQPPPPAEPVDEPEPEEEGE